MKLEKYTQQLSRLPQRGRQIIAQTQNNCITLYQAFNPKISEYAVKHQKFGGDHYSFNRMSWIKPGFLWMMYRAGWASKEHQQNILAISLPLEHFKTILSQATISSFSEEFFASQGEWKNELAKTEVRLQWDPDHNPLGDKQSRKAIQIGLKGTILKQFCTEWIHKIEDITPFVKSEYEKVKNNRLEDLDVPFEEIIQLNNPELEKRIGISANI